MILNYSEKFNKNFINLNRHRGLSFVGIIIVVLVLVLLDIFFIIKKKLWQ